ncbi:MAG: ATP-binding protein [Deltaproteobacteria bacterium]|nr:ATP-binding protein [Deltaproteobacteria bacterium]
MTVHATTNPVDTNSGSAGRQDRLRRAQISQVYSHSLVGGLAALLGGIVFAGSLWGTISHAGLVAWILCYVALFVVRLLLVSAFRKTAPTGDELFAWGTRHSAVTFLSGLIWTAAAVFIFPEDSEYLQIFMIIFGGGIVAGAVVVYSPTNEYLINILLVLAPLAGRFIYQDADHDSIIGVILVMFGGFMALLGHNIHKLYVELLTLRFQKDDLIEDLKADISTRTRAVAAITQLRADAEAASAAKSEFLTNMSHELRTPLTAVIGFAELLSEQFFGKLNEKQLGYVREIFDAGHHLLRLINDILDLAKVESGKMELMVSSVNLSQLLDNSLNMVKGRAGRRGLDLDLIIQENLEGIEILTDEIKLKQILVNLLSNATKFTPYGGRIRLEVERKADELIVSVSDTGVGIKPGDQQHIFEAFERLDSSLSSPESGTGLGLALVRRLVGLHGGRVWVESEGEGKGSTFRFVIPFVKTPKENVGKAEPLPEPGRVPTDRLIPKLPVGEQEKLKVLVVEDNDPNMKLIVNLLEAGGYNAIQAFSAEEGIRSAEINNPALILMDLSLPGMDGLTATGIIKNNPLTSHIPIVAFTANTMKMDTAMAKRSGCDAYLVKPVDISIFYSTLAGLVKQQERKSK